MFVKSIVEEDFIQYKKPSMFIGCNFCDFKCGEACQNSAVLKQPDIFIQNEDIVKRYLLNPITKSIVFGGLEPVFQREDISDILNILISLGCNDDVVIYTGYYRCEIEDFVKELSFYPNLIIKYGRYISNNTQYFNEVLGVMLASSNQYAERI